MFFQRFTSILPSTQAQPWTTPGPLSNDRSALARWLGSLLLVLALVILAVPTARGQCFTTATNFAVGDRPYSVAVGDFNADGKPDLAVANRESNTVSVLLGQGNGSFATATNFDVGSKPHSVAVGDFNADGKPDLAVANNISSTVSVLLGQGNGSFAAATNFSVGSGPQSVAVGDFNADGKPDLATANQSSSNVSVLLGQGNGSFAAATNFLVDSSRPNSVAVGDFNADGKADLATANYGSNDVSVLLGQGNGSFAAATKFTVGSFPYSVAVGDFNADGKPDLAVANIFSSKVSVILGQGNGSFGAATNFAVGNTPESVAVGDFNADGKPDLAVANYGSNNVSVLLGQGNGSFAAATNFDVDSGPSSVAVGDFNADGQPDLATANNVSDNVSVLTNTLVSVVSQPPSSSAVCVGSPVSASVSVSGSVTSYQWYKDGAVLASQTSATLSLSAVQTTDQGSYSVVVTGACNSLTSTTFSLTVSSPPSVSLTNNGPLTCSQPSITLSATPGAATYQFGSGATQQGGNAGNSATVATPGIYSLTALSSSGCSATAATTVTSTANLSLAAGASLPQANVGVTLSLTASGATAYQWTAPSSAPLTGPANAAITSASLTTAGIQTFTVVGTSGVCSQTALVSLTALTGPDLSPLLQLPSGGFATDQTKALLVQIQEVNGGTASGPILITITVPSGYSISFDNTLTSIELGGSPTPVLNAKWQISSSAGPQQLRLSLISGESVSPHSTMNLGVWVSRTTANTGSFSNITVNVADDSGGSYDVNRLNNIYARIINGL